MVIERGNGQDLELAGSSFRDASSTASVLVLLFGLDCQSAVMRDAVGARQKVYDRASFNAKLN